MDTGFQHLSFASNSSSNAFEQLRKAMQAGVVGTSTCTDTDLRLELPNSHFPNAVKGIKRKWNMVDGSKDSVDVSSLVLGLGPSSSDSKGSSATAGGTSSSAKETEEESSVDLNLNFDLQLGNEKNYGSKKSASVILNAQADVSPMLDLELCLSTRPAESVISVNFYSTSKNPNSKKRVSTVPLLDDDSASSLCQPGNCLSPINLPHNTDPHFPAANIPDKFHSVSIVPELSGTTPKSSVTYSSGVTQQLQQQQQRSSSSSKVCQFRGCGKGARGASGLCIAHGGGRRCQKAGCHKGAEGRTVYCKAHGGGRRCQHLGCTKSAEGRTDNCIAHGGGRRCNHEGCTRAARGKSGLCIRHGGGKRCQMENCKKSAEGYSGLCISHGGGRRCQFPECSKGAQGSTMFCKAHGGGKRCTIMGCTKGAEGSTPFCKGHGGGKRCSFQGGGICPKSVHGGTLFCVAHGGGKRCAMPECTKSARGRTDFCVRHGGGKRCKFEGCGKSAQGSTDFCKAHGGGKRCSWGQLGYEFGGQASSPCDRFARGKTGLCAAHSALVQDQQVHGGGTIRPNLYDPKASFSGKMNKAIIVEDMNVDVIEEGSTGGSFVGCYTSSSSESGGYPAVSLQFLPQVHLPMGLTDLPPRPISISEGRVHGGSGPASVPEGRVHGGSFPISVPEGRVHGGSHPISVPEGRVHGGSHPMSVPEGRVHGGSLMSLLAGNASFGPNRQNLDASGPSEPGKSYAVVRNWM